MLMQKQFNKLSLWDNFKKLNAGDNATDPGDDQSMSVLKILEKIKEMRFKFSQEKYYKQWQIIKKWEFN